MFIDYYRLLGIEPDDNEERLEQAFKDKAAYYNPTTNRPSANIKAFNAVLDAYAILKDPARKAQYDAQWYEFHAKNPRAAKTSPLPADEKKTTFTQLLDFDWDAVIPPEPDTLSPAERRKAIYAELWFKLIVVLIFLGFIALIFWNF